MSDPIQRFRELAALADELLCDLGHERAERTSWRFTANELIAINRELRKLDAAEKRAAKAERKAAQWQDYFHAPTVETIKELERENERLESRLGDCRELLIDFIAWAEGQPSPMATELDKLCERANALVGADEEPAVERPCQQDIPLPPMQRGRPLDVELAAPSPLEPPDMDELLPIPDVAKRPEPERHLSEREQEIMHESLEASVEIDPDSKSRLKRLAVQRGEESTAGRICPECKYQLDEYGRCACLPIDTTGRRIQRGSARMVDVSEKQKPAHVCGAQGFGRHSIGDGYYDDVCPACEREAAIRPYTRVPPTDFDARRPGEPDPDERPFIVPLKAFEKMMPIPQTGQKCDCGGTLTVERAVAICDRCGYGASVGASDTHAHVPTLGAHGPICGICGKQLSE